MPEYLIVNPIIGGNLNTKISGENNLEAANNAYQLMAKNFSNSMPEFYFTLQEAKSKNTQIGGGRSNDYTHYLVTEKKKKLNVSYRLVKYKI